jgi:hypothetical protein
MVAWLSLTTLMAASSAQPTLANVALVNPLPVTVMTVPAAPVLGVNELMTGCGRAEVTVKLDELLPR